MDDATDEERISALCRDRLGQTPRSIESIPVGLGLRRFYRVGLGDPPHSLIARIETEEDPAGRPVGIPPEPPLGATRDLFEAAGLPVPRCHAEAGDGAIMLLEDGGSRTLEEAYAHDPENARELLASVIDEIPRLQRIRDPGHHVAFRRALDDAHFRYKADLFAEWSLPEALGRPATPAERDAVGRAFSRVAEICARVTPRLAHRDLQSRNLLVSGDRILWIDLQGALMAPPEYDLVCLLCDSYIEWPDEVVRGSLERVRPELPDAPSASEMARRFALLTLTRKGKDHARFRYVAQTRGDTEALRHLPVTVRHLQRAARRLAGEHTDLDPLLDWIAALPAGPKP